MVIWVMGSLVDWMVRDVVAGFGERVRVYLIFRVGTDVAGDKVSYVPQEMPLLYT